MLLEETVIAAFTAPQQIGINPQSILWLLPLVAAIAIVYKTTKLKTINAGNFLKEASFLFLSIVVFIATTAVALHLLAWLVTS
ncbi:MAG: hypothetical protein JXB29_10840 [Sedimentisphaerales bacterium]|nr:hypothetical protein [Sedimentisphaerales bacterium]